MGAPQVTLVVKKPPAMQETQEMALESLDQEDPLRVGSGKPLQYPCLKTPMDRGAWWAIVHRVTESETTEHIGRLSPNPHTRSFYYIYIYIYMNSNSIVIFLSVCRPIALVILMTAQ